MTSGSVNFSTPPVCRRNWRASEFALTPGHSDSHVELGRSALILDATNINLRYKNTVTLKWFIMEEVNSLDWIGMYFEGKRESHSRSL